MASFNEHYVVRGGDVQALEVSVRRWPSGQVCKWKVDLTALREVAALDVRPLVACIEQCEQIAAPFYRIGEIQALRDVGKLGLRGVA